MARIVVPALFTIVWGICLHLVLRRWKNSVARDTRMLPAFSSLVAFILASASAFLFFGSLLAPAISNAANTGRAALRVHELGLWSAVLALGFAVAGMSANTFLRRKSPALAGVMIGLWIALPAATIAMTQR